MAFGIDDALMLLQLASLAKGLWDAFNPPQPPPMPPPPPTLSWEEAKQRATELYNPIFDEQLQKTMENLDKQALARGVFGQLPAEALRRATAADIERARAQSIGQLANQLVGQSEEAARQQQQLAMQYAMNNWNTQLANQIARTNALMSAARSATDTWATLATHKLGLPKWPWQETEEPTAATQLTSALNALAANLRSGPVTFGASGPAAADPLASGLMRAWRTPGLSFENPYGG